LLHSSKKINDTRHIDTNHEYRTSPKIRDFVFDHGEHDAGKNMYFFASDELYIYRLNDIFNKVTNIARFDDLHSGFHMMCSNGFKFYRSAIEKTIMTNHDILYSCFNVIKICQENKNENIRGRFGINNGVIYRRRGSVPIFNIIETSFLDNTSKVRDNLYIRKCNLPKQCVIKLMFPDMNHYHGKYRKDNIYNSGPGCFEQLVMLIMTPF
jgi:hypothetical protein